MDFFSQVEQAPPDSILGLNASFHADSRTHKVNLGAGVYKTEDLKPYILNCVKQAEGHLLHHEVSKDYLPIDGLATYIKKTQELVFSSELKESVLYGAQTVGGTAALCVGARFLRSIGFKTVYLSNPTWANHHRVFQQAGFDLSLHTYLDKKKLAFDCNGFLSELSKMREKSVVLLQVSCHNPTGFDPTLKQWEEISALIEKKRLFPFFDLAYQGFGENLVADAAPLNLFCRKGILCAVAVSHAKNFGLYAERPGVLFFLCREPSEREKVGSQIRVIIRGLYSNPPSHGARIIAHILEDSALKQLWMEELTAMRHRILTMRQRLAEKLHQKTGAFDFLYHQKGMFSYTGLHETQVNRLINEYAIYLPKDGRINVAGLNDVNISYVIESILKVL